MVKEKINNKKFKLKPLLEFSIRDFLATLFGMGMLMVIFICDVIESAYKQMITLYLIFRG